MLEITVLSLTLVGYVVMTRRRRVCSALLSLAATPLILVGSLFATARPAFAGAVASQNFDYTFVNGAATVSCRFTFMMENADYNGQANVGYVQFDVARLNAGAVSDCLTVTPGTYLGVYWRTPDDGGGYGAGNLYINFPTTLPTHYTRTISPVATNQHGFQMTLVGTFAHCTSGCDFSPLMEAPHPK